MPTVWAIPDISRMAETPLAQYASSSLFAPTVLPSFTPSAGQGMAMRSGVILGLGFPLSPTHFTGAREPVGIGRGESGHVMFSQSDRLGDDR